MFNSQRPADGDAPRDGEVQPLEPDAALDQVLVEGLVSAINSAYAVGGAGFWREGTTRTDGRDRRGDPRGGMLVATRDDRLVGCAYVRPLDARTADLGLVSVDRTVGAAASARARALGGGADAGARQIDNAARMLVPVGWTHPEKVKPATAPDSATTRSEWRRSRRWPRT